MSEPTADAGSHGIGGHTLPSVVMAESAADPSLLVGLGSQIVRVLVGIALIAAWVSVWYGELSIDERVHTRTESEP